MHEASGRAQAMFHSMPLISTAELAGALMTGDLRVYDCTTHLDAAPPGSDTPYLPRSGIATFTKAHIPGADYLDLDGQFSDKATPLRFMMPARAELVTAFEQHGIGDRIKVALYSVGSMMWATRFWWMLRALGFENAAILDGGFDKWQAEGRPIESGPPHGYPKAVFTATPRSDLFVDRHGVLTALADPGAVIVNALAPTYHRGAEPSRYGRAGRIPGSVNVPAATLLDPKTHGFTSLEEARATFEAQGVSREKKVICYCGGGISATLNLLLLHRLGYSNLALYDGSMGEWARDQSLPIETD